MYPGDVLTSVHVSGVSEGRQTQPEFGPVRRYIDTIKLQRGDFNGRVLSVRNSDVWAMAAMATVDPPTFVHTLERLHVLRD